MLRSVLVLALTAALLAAAAGQQADCDISDPAALSRCLKRLLGQSRDKVRREADPLRLPNHNDGDFEARDIVVRGLAGYSVDHLSVTFPSEQQIALRATISWPSIVGDLSAKVRKCKRIIFKLCAKARGRPHVTVGRTVGSLTTTLTINVSPSGQITVQPSGTAVSLQLPGIKVKANVRGLIGKVNRIIGDPASRFATKLSNKWWRNNKGKIEKKARDALDKAVREDLSVHLAELIRL